MKSSRLVLPCSALLLAGCGNSERVHENDPYGSSGDTMVRMHYTDAVDNAVLAQHTLFPHHFVVNSAELNELGERDLGILARHFVTAPGQVNVRRGAATEALHAERVSAVRQRMGEFGVDVERISVESGLPGGSGMSSDFVLNVMAELSGGEVASPASSITGAKKTNNPMSTRAEGDRNDGSTSY